MPSKTEKQRKLFGMALAYKRGENKDASSEVIKLAELPEKTLKDYASKVEESIVTTMAHNERLVNQKTEILPSYGRMYTFMEWKKSKPVTEDWVFDMNEARKSKYDFQVYHPSYTSAIAAAMEWAKLKGFEVEEDDKWSQIAVGPGRPREGETSKASLGLIKDGKKQRKHLQIQVYGMKNQYELNMYIN